MSGQISIDAKSLRSLHANFSDVAKKIPDASYQALVTFLFNAKALAQNRILDKQHVVTSRLRNSIYVKSHAKRQDQKQYSDKLSRTWNAELNDANIGPKEAAVGTNVEYAQNIERIDSFLWWGIQNADDKEFVKEYNKQVNAIKYNR